MRALEYLAVTAIALSATYLTITPIAHAVAQSIEHSAAIVGGAR